MLSFPRSNLYFSVDCFIDCFWVLLVRLKTNYLYYPSQ
ncbi:hypothetical protein CY0110_16447 [Crocosphaera chwakensis CCY0110]|uniref:Uncharacterized protein n=1 Tax=Crocosphaera chwakensis CCY0110 TaxID=391612 RepID=A3IHX1_9CHRO|nr:hypothetical protein CY0110_16447 [Crocosphaera chwakensis CCY0110]